MATNVRDASAQFATVTVARLGMPTDVERLLLMMQLAYACGWRDAYAKINQRIEVTPHVS